MTPSELATYEAQGYRVKYQRLWPPLNLGVSGGKPLLMPIPDWLIEVHCFNNLEGFHDSVGFLGKVEHFKRLITALLGQEDSLYCFEWNPNACLIVERFFEHRFLAIGGCSNSGKTRTMVVIAIGMFLVNPQNTKVLVTSTTMQSSEDKIWGDMTNAWNQACRIIDAPLYAAKVDGTLMPGKLMRGDPVIRCETVDPNTGKTIINPKAGIRLMPTNQGSNKESVEKAQGVKTANPTPDDIVIFIGDEWDTLTPQLVDTVKWNILNNSKNKCIAAYNPTSRTSPGGIISEPAAGWDSVNVESTEWATTIIGGWNIHFDAHNSPNVLCGTERWKGLTTKEGLQQKEEEYGSAESPHYWAMVRGWFPPQAQSLRIYAEEELTVTYAAMERVMWLDSPIRIAALDPSFVHGGDFAVLMFGLIGTAWRNERRVKCFMVEQMINLDKEIRVDAGKKDVQVVQLTKKHMDRLNVPPRNLCVDLTGAASFGSLLGLTIGNEFYGVSSSNAPTDLPISPSDKRLASGVFRDLMSEMWYVGLPLLREFQIAGLDAQTIKEMVNREFKEVGKKICVESKREMRKRTAGKSPNFADAFFLGLMIARMRFGLSSAEKALKRPVNHPSEDPLAFLKPRWGEKVQPPVQEVDFVAMGGGWSDL